MESQDSSRTGIQSTAHLWEVTKGCNLRCIHCRATATELSSPTDLSPPNTRSISSSRSQISGIPSSYSVVASRSIGLTFSSLRALPTGSSGFAWPSLERYVGHKPVAKKIVEAGVKRVSISLDGADALTARYLRGIPRSIRSRDLRHAQSARARDVGADQHDNRAAQCSPVAGRA